MAIKTITLPGYGSLTGMYAFLYHPTTGALLNSGGDALTLKSGSDLNSGLFEFDVTEDLSALDWVEVRIHASATASPANLLWYASLVKLESHCQDACPPVANHYTTKWTGRILSWLLGNIANAQTATESTTITVDGRTFVVTLTDATETGNRGTTVFTES